jgi:hypothetical protein
LIQDSRAPRRWSTDHFHSHYRRATTLRAVTNRQLESRVAA